MLAEATRDSSALRVCPIKKYFLDFLSNCIYAKKFKTLRQKILKFQAAL